MTSAGPTFADLVAVAAVGTAQRPLPPLPEHLVPPGPADQSAATRLLDAAAAFAVVRRARLPVEHGLTGAATAPDDSGDPPPPRFVAALARALAVELPPNRCSALAADGWRSSTPPGRRSRPKAPRHGSRGPTRRPGRTARPSSDARS